MDTYYTPMEIDDKTALIIIAILVVIGIIALCFGGSKPKNNDKGGYLEFDNDDE